MVRRITSLILQAVALFAPPRWASAQSAADAAGIPHRASDTRGKGAPRLTVTVQTPTGAPIRDALVALDEPRSYSRTDSSGRAYLGPFMAGSYHLRVVALGHRMYRDTIAITAERWLHIVLPADVFNLSEICVGSCTRVRGILRFPIRAITDTLTFPPFVGAPRQRRPNRRLQLTGRMRGGSRAVFSNLRLRGCHRTPRS